ncbi:MAG: hypothetical protein WC766_06190 [Patescibacteria group bacterium]|jgi:hypothetical protein
MAWTAERLAKFRASIAGKPWGAGRKKVRETQAENQAQGEQPAPTVELPNAPLNEIETLEA